VPVDISKLLDPGPITVGAVAGALGSHVWRRFRGRLTVIRCWIERNCIADSRQDARLGTTAVLFNGKPVHNVYVFVVRFKNDSNRDLQEVSVDLQFKDGTTMLSAIAGVDGSPDLLEFSPAYKRQLADLVAIPDAEADRKTAALESATTRRGFIAPVLNRMAQIVVVCVVQGQPQRVPFVEVACVHPGAMLSMEAPGPKLFDVDVWHAILVGLISTATSLAIVYYWLGPSSWLTVGSFVVGAVATIIGAGLARLSRFVVQVMS
jgi:hypothetical protein